MNRNLHPNEALFDKERLLPTLPGCEHFAGSEKLILKALQLQNELGPAFDITCDCEDGAVTGQEEQHVSMVTSIIASPSLQLLLKSTD